VANRSSPNDKIPIKEHKILAKDMVETCTNLLALLKVEPRVIRASVSGNQKIVTIGDLHGNLDDLEYILRSNPPSSDCKLVFIGDFPDRGLESVQLIFKLFGIKAKHPNDVILLRGNHEDPQVNGSPYMDNNLKHSCKMYFGIKNAPYCSCN